MFTFLTEQSIMDDVETSPETRPTAPGPLGVLQDFLNSGHLGADMVVGENVVEAVRARAEAGDHQATIAKEFGLVRGLVAAISRGARTSDELFSPEAAAEWLAARGLLGPHAALDGSGHERLVAFRELLRELAADHTHGVVDAGRLAQLEAVAASAPLAARFASPDEVALEPTGAGADEAIGRLLVILYDAIRDGSWRRLKRCPGMGCPFTFYDSSRNRTATWCSMSVCGNRAKVRSYQERRRSARPV